MKVLYYLGSALSMGVGIWHFFVPHLYQWYDYLPMQYENLIVGIDYTNYFFSLLLTGLSLLLILSGKKAFAANREIIVFYGFLVFVWLNRALITFVHPWPLEPVAWAAHGQQIAAITIFLLLAASFVYLIRKPRAQKGKAVK